MKKSVTAKADRSGRLLPWHSEAAFRGPRLLSGRFLRGQGCIATLGQYPLDTLDHPGGRHVVHAGVVVGTVAEPAQVTGRARDMGLNHGAWPAIRSNPDRVGRPENADDGFA